LAAKSGLGDDLRMWLPQATLVPSMDATWARTRMGSYQIPIKALIVGSHTLVCQSIVHMLRDAGSIDVRGTTFAGLENRTGSIDVAVCVIEPETSLDDLEEVVQDIRDRCPGAKVACLFLDDNDASMVAAVRAGATGIIDESVAHGASFPAELLNQITRVAEGEFVCSYQVAHRLAKFHSRGTWRERSGHPKDESLTQREHEVLCLLSEGRTNRDIAAHLSLSEHTVRTHLRGIMQKLHVTNRVQAAAMAWKGNRSMAGLKEEQ
jgi:DNA-binding NarL/FixJ family response regulator